MTAYLIALETIHDEAMFAEYRKQLPRSKRSAVALSRAGGS